MMFSPELKESMVRRLIAPGAPSPDKLALETGIGKTTLWRWRKEALADMPSKKKKQRPNSRSSADKLRLVLDSQGLEGQELGAFLRKEGVHLTDLEQWKEQMLEGLDSAPARTRQERQRTKKAERKAQALAAELRRKEAALAETAALLVLSKKARRLLGDEDDTTTGTPEESS